MNTAIKKMWGILLVGAIIQSLNSCSKSDGPNDNPDMGKKGIQLHNDNTFGKVLTDKGGKVLYFFSNDADGKSACTGNCTSIWPIYYAGEASSDPDIDKSHLGEIIRADGSKQSTYKGWPLYYFASDSKSGDIKGDGVQDIWYVAKPDYSMMVANNQLIGADGKSYREDYSEGTGNTLYFTDDKGRTLYAFAPDKFNSNTFTKPDFSNDPVWPIYQQPIGALPSIVTKTDVGLIQVFGKPQLTYKGWPLYYFGQDINRDDNKGVSVPKPGVWPIVNTKTKLAPSA